MRSRILVGTLVALAVLASGVLAASDAGGSPTQQWTNTYFLRPTMVAGVAIQGPVMILHDDQQMAEGKDCTKIYRLDPKHGPQQLLVSFMCTPANRVAVDKFTATCARLTVNGFETLVAYQFPGDTEAHEVPLDR
jgi:hypothetical protein